MFCIVYTEYIDGNICKNRLERKIDRSTNIDRKIKIAF